MKNGSQILKKKSSILESSYILEIFTNLKYAHKFENVHALEKYLWVLEKIIDWKNVHGFINVRNENKHSWVVKIIYNLLSTHEFWNCSPR